MAPSAIFPLMKKLGVPDTPFDAAISSSAANRESYFLLERQVSRRSFFAPAV